MKRGVLVTTAAVLVVVAVVTVLYARSVQEHRYPVRMLDRATSLAQEIPVPEPRVRALVAVAESALQCDDRERAELLLRQAGAYLVAIDEPVSRHAAPALTVSAMLRAGLKDEATQVVHGVSHDEVRRLLQECIAQQKPPSEEMDALITMVRGVEEARQLAMQLGDAGSPVLIEICVAKAKAGKLEEALQIAREAEEPVRSDAMRAIAQELSNLGYLADALYVARNIHSADQRDDALSIISVHLARASNFGEAERVLQEVQRNEARYSAQCRVAEEMARAGKLGDAERIFSLAMRTARGIDDRTERSRALSWIASSMARTAVTWRAHQRYH